MDDLKTRAEARLDAALAEADVQDPRDHYRRALKALRQRDPDGFDAALRYFEEDLIPAVAGDADPIDTWIEYGTMLARTLGEGRTSWTAPAAPDTCTTSRPPGGSCSICRTTPPRPPSRSGAPGPRRPPSKPPWSSWSMAGRRPRPTGEL
jgi:hypothetical protein